MSNKKNCAGTYPVRRYKRSDGTEVSAYMRTCGAKHVGDSIMESKSNYNNTISSSISLSVNDIDDLLLHIEKVVNEGNLYSIQEILAKLFLVKNQCLKYYRIALDLENAKLYDKENNYLKFKDIDDNILKTEIRKSSDIENLNDCTDVVIPHIGSKLNQDIIKSQEFSKLIKENKEDIKKGKYKNKCLPITFSSSRDLRLTLGHAMMYNPRYIDGVLCATIWDGYNFEFKKAELLKNLLKTKTYNDLPYIIKDIIYKLINNNALKQQKLGKLRNFLIIMPIILF
ncbi:MAG: hypothetical protein ACI4S3_07640 [Candidatus Gastranaerophilaceae bacterium]